MNTASKKSGAVIGILLPVGLICLFAFCSLALALMGGQAYKQMNNSIDDSYGSTVTASYLRTKLAQNNQAGCISLSEEDGMQVLTILTGLDATYETRIFMHDGALRESVVTSGRELNVAQSTEIAQVQSCTFTVQDDGLLEVEIVSPGGVSTRLAFALAGEEEA